jgi:hypothetical protein
MILPRKGVRDPPIPQPLSPRLGFTAEKPRADGVDAHRAEETRTGTVSLNYAAPDASG